MSQKRLLILAPAFPPHPSPATHRARFLARYGPEAGWDVEVLTLDPASYEETLDHELERLVPASARITRVRGIDPTWTRRFGIGDVGLRALVPMYQRVEATARTARPDLIYIPGGPFYTFRIGPAMLRRHGIPYVVDYTDPWVTPAASSPRTPLAKAYWANRLASWLEPTVVRRAAHIISVSEGTNQSIRERHPEIPADRFSAFPFGFEPTDFETLRAHPRPNALWDAADGRFHFAYVGVMWPPALPALRALFAAIRSIGDADPAWRDRVRFHFIGTSYDPRAERGLVAPTAAELGVADVVTEHVRRVPYLDALNVLTRADGLLGIGGTDVHYTASKIFPCILARRPMLALYHAASTVCDVARRADGIRLVTFDDRIAPEQRVPRIAEALRAIVSDRATPAAVAIEELAPFTAASISRDIFAVFDRALLAAPTRPALARAG